MGVLLKNNARSTLSAAINATDTAIRVRVGHGDRFPSPINIGEWFPLTLEDESGNIEILRAVSRQGDVITVVRGAEGTQARAYAAGIAVELRATAAAFANADSPAEQPVTVSISNGTLG